ncbi:hypothetical protein SDRG_01266 [Saprolegnia diclina VS20]|uniref:Atg6 BARA domain-containing protein n=1 Tax=Saprolegnia diclina (strain VS20) TaxID=1156394 RepID=T0R2V6_SAPDV|nr:hypothetical protein SDRG_01266 [Saprolegnia diclina VS20]EQC41291.1 hypothetical protein SDRG_01266 [Saprolegnia diclina VS20]|eukprot:XP_008605005.1 hypothetical protein SDRG_01266 [Saprolegnia diclina VS20]
MSDYCVRCKHGSNASLDESYVNVHASAMNPAMSTRDASLSHADVSSHVKKMQRLHVVADGVATASLTSPQAFCTDCLHLLTTMLEKNNENARYEKRVLASFLSSTPKTKSPPPVRRRTHHDRLMQSMRDERVRIEADLERLELEMAELEYDEMAVWASIDDRMWALAAQRELRDMEIARVATMEQRARAIRRLNVASDAFYIWHKGPFGTINGFSMGRLPTQHTDWHEINAAWGEATLLLQHIAECLGVAFHRYRLVPLGNASKVIRLQRPEMEYHLHGSDQDAFPESFFNLGIAAWLDCLGHLETWVLERDLSFRLPYKITASDVGNFSLLFLRDDEAWTKASKNALTNLKWLLAWSAKPLPATS